MSLSVDKKREGWRKASKKYYEKNKEKIKEYNKKLGKKYFADSTMKYAHNNKDKVNEKAKRVYNKDKTKQIVRVNTNSQNIKTGICFNCKKKRKTEFHHLTYKPNKFIEICRECHNSMHGRNYYGR